MAEDKSKAEAIAAIRGHQAAEVREDCKYFDVTPDRLREALLVVGYDGEKIRRYLQAASQSERQVTR